MATGNCFFALQGQQEIGMQSVKQEPTYIPDVEIPNQAVIWI